MANFYRFKVDLGNFGDGSPGVIILHSTTGLEDNLTDIGNFMSQIKNGFDTVKGHIVPGMTVTVNSEVTKHDVETGRLLNVFVVTPPAAVVGAGNTSGVSRATQAVCRHNTDAITDRGKRLIGRSYVGPISSGAMDTGGHISPTAQTAFSAMWAGMQDVAGTLRLIVWHRPLEDHTNGEVISPGSFGHVQNTVCLTKPGVLRGRRD